MVRQHVIRGLLAALVMVGCVAGEEGGHDEPSDFDEVDWTSGDGKADVAGIPATFNRHTIFSDDLLLAENAVTVAAIQAFLEDSPYGTRSWLADYTVDGKAFSQILVEEAQAGDINPVVLLARMQVEKSLISKTVKPGTSSINAALGCGCPDGAACSTAYAGMRKQLRCATEVLSDKFGESVDGTGQWAMGKRRNTLDPLAITPTNHATAALYAYTPWVLTGRGGNWLVWNVTRRFLRHFDEAGTLVLP